MKYFDRRVIFLRKNDNIEHKGKFYRIKNVWIPTIDLSIGTALTSAKELAPKEENILVHVIPSTESTNPIYGYMPEKIPLWLSPDGTVEGYIDKDISPKDDPNETKGFYLMEGDEPKFKCPGGATTGTFYCGIYELELLVERPGVYTPIPENPVGKV